MRRKIFYADAAAILFCCALLTPAVCGSAAFEIEVEILLTLVIASALLLTLSGRILYIAELLLPVLSLLVPEGILLVPAALYTSAADRSRIPLLTGTLCLVIRTALSGGSSGYTLTAAVSLLSVILGLRTGELDLRSNEMIKMRDNDAELEMQLRRSNRELLRKQDDEVNLATLRERNRIAREIHDNVGHLLSRALLQSGALLAVTDKEKMPVQYTQTSALKETLGTAMDSVRESVHGLRDESVDLHRAVTEAANAVGDRFRVHTELDFSEKMSPQVKLCFIAVVKEALSNALKHSSGDTINIIIREHPALYQLCVTDNGRPSAISHGGGMGLNNMRERAEALGGIFTVDNSDGFRIFISVKRATEEQGIENSSGR